MTTGNQAELHLSPRVEGAHDTGSTSPCQVAQQSRWAVFADCPHCDGPMRPEHAHYRCARCGWRDSCCD